MSSYYNDSLLQKAEAWNAVFAELLRHDPDFYTRAENGQKSAVLAIRTAFENRSTTISFDEVIDAWKERRIIILPRQS